MGPDIIRFEGFEYRPAQHSLCYAGQRLTVGSRALALLDALLSRPGMYVSVADLMQAAWPETHVDENNLRVQMSALRRHFELCGRPVVQNAPGRGYAFVGSIEEAARDERDVVLVFSLTSGNFDLRGVRPDQLAPALRAVLKRIEPEAGSEHNVVAEGRGAK